MDELGRAMMRLAKLRATMKDYHAEGKRDNFVLAFDMAEALLGVAEAGMALRVACHTGQTRSDGSQAGVRMPEREHVIALDKALRALDKGSEQP